MTRSTLLILGSTAILTSSSALTATANAAPTAGPSATAPIAGAPIAGASIDGASSASRHTPAPANGDLLVTINGNLFLIAPSGTNRRQLTRTGGISDAQFSPDGKRIAFGRSQNGSSDLYVMTANGTGVTRLTNTPDVNETNPTWSPDAQRLAFTRDVRTSNRGDGIAVMAVRSNARATVIKANRYRPQSWDIYSDPKWSPRGSWLAIAHRVGSHGGCDPVWTERITPAGAELAGRLLAAEPDIHPAGTWMVGAAHEDCGDTWIVKDNVRTDRETDVTDPWADDGKSNPVWSPTGAQIAYARSDYVTEVGEISELAVVNADGTGMKTLVGSTPNTRIIPRDWRAR